MKAFVIAILVFVSFAAEARTRGTSDAQIEEAIQTALSQRRSTESDFWRELGPRAPKILERMYLESRLTYRKVRLLSALGNFESPEVGSFIRETALASTNSKIRLAAIRALGRSQGMREEAFLARQLKSSNPHTRLAAAEALKSTGDRRAITLVDNYMKNERASWVIARLKKSGT